MRGLTGKPGDTEQAVHGNASEEAMKMKTHIIPIIIGVTLSAMLFTSCATTTITSVWKDSLYQGQPKKIMVIGKTSKAEYRRTFEDEFVRQLKARGMEAVASYTVMSDEKLGSHTEIAAKIKDHGNDTILISRLVRKKTVQTYVSAKVYHPSEKYGSWRDYYGYDADEVYIPGHMIEDEYVLMESNLYSVVNDKLIWSAMSETEFRGSGLKQIKSYVAVMVKSMIEQGLTPR